MDYRRNIICIDLKSFFASCECVERNLDPFKVNLVVADPDHEGSITLAVTPAMKKLGVPSRGRVYAIPKTINYIIVKPRMSLYLKKSQEVVNIYLDFVSSDDLHVYSIDEVFMDVTDYLNYHKLNDYELALKILKTIKEKTGLTATCGIGPNMLLAKIAMDVEAKHNKDCIAKWDYHDIKDKLWNIKPLSKMWGIGSAMERNLNILGINSVYDLAHYDKNKLKIKFGVMGEELWNHANGIDMSRISDFKKLPQDISYSHSQILHKDYHENNIKIIIKEMIELLTARLRKNNKMCNVIGFGIGYSRNFGGGFYHSMKLSASSDNTDDIYKVCSMMFDDYYDFTPIRKVSISLGKLTKKIGTQLSIFDDPEEIIKKNKLDRTIDEIKDNFGKNTILKASALLSDSTIKERNEKIGGHSA